MISGKDGPRFLRFLAVGVTGSLIGVYLNYYLEGFAPEYLHVLGFPVPWTLAWSTLVAAGWNYLLDSRWALR